MNHSIKKGLAIISEVMNETNQFDFFYKSIGDFWNRRGEYKKAIDAYNEYSKKFPEDLSVENNIKHCFKMMGGEK
jgi:hypothetical protein